MNYTFSMTKTDTKSKETKDRKIMIITLQKIRAMNVEELDELIAQEGTVFLSSRGLFPLKITRAELS